MSRSQQLYSYLGRAALWTGIRDKLAAMGARLAPDDEKALNDLCSGVTWMQRVPPALLASYRALYVIVRGDAADEEEEINRDILRTVRGETGLLLDFSEGQRTEFAASINRVLNALALVDGMGYCQGQNYVVDVMLKAGLPEREVFCLFLYLLRQGHLHGIYRKEVPMLAGYMDKFEEQLRVRLPHLAAHFEAEHYPPPLYALEWMTTLFGLAARPLISLVGLDLFLAGARNPVLRLCVSILGIMEEDLTSMDQEGMLREFRAKAVLVDAEEALLRALMEGGGDAAQAQQKRSRERSAKLLGWSTGPDYLLVLRSRHCQTVGLYELREEARSDLLPGNTALQDALLAVTRSLGWGRLRTCWLESCLAARSDHERYRLANESLRFVITNGGHVKAAAFMLALAGADANGVDYRLLSPLHLAALFNRPDIARTLLMCGASATMKGGVTRAAAAKGGKLWSPLEMAEEACTQGGELDEAGVAVGPAALFVLRGIICLQCNLKIWKPSPCSSCNLSFCKMCTVTHYCIGCRGLPKGVVEGLEGSVPSEYDSMSSGTSGSGRWQSERRGDWEPGCAISDGWETLFAQNLGEDAGAINVNNDGEWVPGGLRRTKRTSSSVASTSPRPAGGGAGAGDGTNEEGGGLGREEEVVWSTMRSVLLGTWEQRPVMSNPRDQTRVYENAAAFVRACFPAQAWLHYHMEVELGLSIKRDYLGHSWGGLVSGLGVRGEFFDPEILRAAQSTQLHRRMSWVMAESGVPWENEDMTWCCPDCFILFSLNVFKHHCRGCGNIYCSAHAPPTPVPPSECALKLCWSCVLEGAVPLTSIVPQEDGLLSNGDSYAYPSLATKGGASVASTATRFARQLSPSSAERNAAATRNKKKTNPAVTGTTHEKQCQDQQERSSKPKADVAGGFFSALVSLIETVAAPITPERSRAGARRKREAAAIVSASAGSFSEVESESSSTSGSSSPDSTPATDGLRARQVAIPSTSAASNDHDDRRGPAAGNRAARNVTSDGRSGNCTSSTSSSSATNEKSRSSAGTISQMAPQQRLDPNRAVAQRGFGAGATITADGGSESSSGNSNSHINPRGKLQRGFGSSVSTVSSTDAGEEEEAMPLQRGFGASGAMKRGFPSEDPMKRGFGPR